MGRPQTGTVNKQSLEKCENVMTEMRLACVALVPVSTELANGFLSPLSLLTHRLGILILGRGIGVGLEMGYSI